MAATKQSAEAIAEIVRRHDLTPHVARWLDRHMIVPLLEFAAEKKLYTSDSVKQARLALVRQTRMADYAEECYRKVEGETAKVPAEMADRKEHVYSELAAGKAACGPLLALVEADAAGAGVLQQSAADKSQKDEQNDDGDATPSAAAASLTMPELGRTHKVTTDHLHALYRYARLSFDCGCYKDAADLLRAYRALALTLPSSAGFAAAAGEDSRGNNRRDKQQQQPSVLITDRAHGVDALWGQLAADILMVSWAAALEDLRTLNDAVDAGMSTTATVTSVAMSADSKAAAEKRAEEEKAAARDPMKAPPAAAGSMGTVSQRHRQALEQRTWLIHWSLFIFFNVQHGHTLMLDFLLQERLLNAIQQACPHILRYLVAAAVLSSSPLTLTQSQLQQQQQQQLQLAQQQRNGNKRWLALQGRYGQAAVLAELVQIVHQERQSYSDPVTAFVCALYIDYDFQAASEHLKDCRHVLQHDFFLDASTDDFITAARLLMFNMYARVHRSIDAQVLRDTLQLNDPMFAQALRRCNANIVTGSGSSSNSNDDEVEEVATDANGNPLKKQPESTASKQAAANKEGDDEAAAAAASGDENDKDNLEGVIVELIRAAGVTAKFDSHTQRLLISAEYSTLYQQVIDQTKGLAYRCHAIAKQVDQTYALLADAE